LNVTAPFADLPYILAVTGSPTSKVEGSP